MRTLASATLILALVGCGQQQEQGKTPPGGPSGSTQKPTFVRTWKPYSSQPYGFKVSFPWGDPINRPYFGTPPPAAAEVCYLSTETWSGDKITYSFTIIPVRFKASSSAAERESVLAGLVKTVSIPKEMTRSKDDAITWAGRPAKEFSFEAAGSPGGKKPRIVFRQLLADTTGYLGYVRDAGDLTSQEVARFFDSFELLSRPGPK
jgi:hypothetical protein